MEKVCKKLTADEIHFEEVRHLSTNAAGMTLTLVKCNSLDDKIKILKNKYKLAKEQDKMFIDCDYTKKEKQIQKEIREKPKEERKKGKEVKIGYQKIKINGTWIKWKKENNQEYTTGGYFPF